MRLAGKIIGVALLLCMELCAHGQVTVLGSSRAFVLDMELDEKNRHVIASTTKEVQIWNYESGILVNTWSIPDILALDFQDKLLAGGSNKGVVYLWDMENGKQLKSYQVNSSPVLSLTWFNGKSIAVGSDDGSVFTINTENGEITNVVKNPMPVTALASGFNGTLLAGDSKGGLNVYSTIDFTLTNAIKAHKRWLREIRVDDSTNHFATASDDNTLKGWRFPGFRELSSISESSWILSFDFVAPTPGSMWITAVGTLNGKVRIRTGYGIYSARAGASINKIVMLKEQLPNVSVIIGTHGRGIRIMNANSMRVNKS